MQHFVKQLSIDYKGDIMKTLKFSLCFFIVLSFSACSMGEFRNIVSFIDSYNSYSDYNLSISDFSYEDNEYTVFLENDIMLSLKEDENDKITLCRIMMPESEAQSSKTRDDFRKTVRDVIVSYCSFTPNEALAVIEEFNIGDDEVFQKKGELTLRMDNFYFICYANEITFEMRIINTYINEPDPTEKPVSKPYYGENFIEKD